MKHRLSREAGISNSRGTEFCEQEPMGHRRRGGITDQT
jgi:hypothetical protein